MKDTSRRTIALASISLALSVFVASCDKKEAPTSSAAPSASAAKADAPPKPAKPPLKIAYSDWPGWTALEIGIQKGWFKEAGVEVDFKWFEYVPSMEAFSAGKVDAVTMTMGDALVTGAPARAAWPSCITDYSNGNDMIVASPGINGLKGLKGKKVGLEVGLVEHLLLLKGLKKAGLKETDVKIVNVADRPDRRSARLEGRRRDRRVAAQLRAGAQGGGRLQGHVHQRRHARAHLRPV